MAEWWTYHPSSFLMFSPRTYWRLFELANESDWPLQLGFVGVGLGGWIVRWRDMARRPVDVGPGWARWGALFHAACWGWVGWAFLHQRYAQVNWPADGLAVAFGVQALALVALAAWGPRVSFTPQARWIAGMLLSGWALVGQPLLGLAFGRPLAQAEVIGIAPDPTLVGMLGYLTLVRAEPGAGRVFLRCLWVVPLSGCAASAATLWTMGSPQAWVLPIAVGVATAGVFWGRTEAGQPLQTGSTPPPLQP